MNFVFIVTFASLTALSRVGVGQAQNDFLSLMDPNFALRLFNQDGMSGLAYNQDFADEVTAVNDLIHIFYFSFVDIILTSCCDLLKGWYKSNRWNAGDSCEAVEFHRSSAVRTQC